MHFEIDLGLDSLARTECFASVEQTLGIELDPQELSTVQKVGELVQLARQD
jgi:acyl carrier protein